MKSVFTTSAVLVLLGAATLGACSTCGTSTDFAREAARALPQEAVFLLAVPSLDRLLDWFPDRLDLPEPGSTADSPGSRTVEPAALATELGFELDEPVWLALLEVDRPVIVLSIGFSGELDNLREVLTRRYGLPAPLLYQRAFGSHQGLELAGMVGIVSQSGRLVMVVAASQWFPPSPAADLAELTGRILDRRWDRSLADLDTFQELTRFDEGAVAVHFANVEAAIEQAVSLLEVDQEEGWWRQVLGFAGALYQDERTDRSVNRLFLAEETESRMPLWGPAPSPRPLSRIPAPVVAGAQVSLNPRLIGTAPEFLSDLLFDRDRILSGFQEFLQEALGVDLDQDVLANITGEIGVFINRLVPGRSDQTRWVAFLGLSRPDQAAHVLERAMERFPVEVARRSIGNLVVFQISSGTDRSISFFMDQDYLWVVAGEEFLGRIASGAGPGFLDQASQQVRSLFTGDGPVAFFIEPEVFEDLVQPELPGLLSSFHHDGDLAYGLFASSRATDRVIELVTDLRWMERTALEAFRPEPPPLPGLSRAHPLPAGSTATLGPWELRVLDFRRGEDAMVVYDADAPRYYRQGYEPVMVGFHARCNGFFRSRYELTDDQIGLVTEQGEHYRPSDALDFLASVETRRGEDGFGVPREHGGRLLFWIPEGAQNLLLVLQQERMPLFGPYSGELRFLALEPGVSIPRTAEASGEPGEGIGWAGASSGSDRDHPVPVGQSVVCSPFQVGVSEVLRGETAFRLMREEGVWQLGPSEGSEYLQVRAWIRYPGEGDIPVPIADSWFHLSLEPSDRGMATTVASLPPQLRTWLYPGGQAEGWMGFEVPVHAVSPVLALELPADGSACHFALEPANTRGLPPGYTRAHPAMPQDEVLSEGWRIRVVEVVREPHSLERLRTQSPSDIPADPAEEYLLVRIQASPFNSFHHLDSSAFCVTGDRLHRIESNYLPCFEPDFDSRGAPPDTPVEGWLTFLVPRGEGNQMLVVNTTQPRFLALDPTASIPEQDFTSLSADQAAGTSPSSPSVMGTPVNLGEWEITVTECHRGPSAREHLGEEFGFFLPEPRAGEELCAITLRIRNVNRGDVARNTFMLTFDLVGSTTAGAGEATGLLLEADRGHPMYPGGFIDVRAAALVSVTDVGPVLVVSHGYQDTLRYIRLCGPGTSYP